jgi:hypothetical protein
MLSVSCSTCCQSQAELTMQSHLQNVRVMCTEAPFHRHRILIDSPYHKITVMDRCKVCPSITHGQAGVPCVGVTGLRHARACDVTTANVEDCDGPCNAHVSQQQPCITNVLCMVGVRLLLRWILDVVATCADNSHVEAFLWMETPHQRNARKNIITCDIPIAGDGPSGCRICREDMCALNGAFSGISETLVERAVVAPSDPAKLARNCCAQPRSPCELREVLALTLPTFGDSTCGQHVTRIIHSRGDWLTACPLPSCGLKHPICHAGWQSRSPRC